jgi:hypothetical protein
MVIGRARGMWRVGRVYAGCEGRQWQAPGKDADRAGRKRTRVVGRGGLLQQLVGRLGFVRRSKHAGGDAGNETAGN